MRRGSWLGPYFLAGAETSGITPLLTPPGKAVGNPYRLRANEGKSFIGSYVLGMGFVLEPEEGQELIAKDPRNADVLFPYLNGEDLNSRPDQSASRWVINFRNWPLDRAEEYPDCIRIVREKVKPERDRNRYSPQARQHWWQFERVRPELYATIAGLDRVLVHPLTSKHHIFVFCPRGIILSHMTVVLALSGWTGYAVLQSELHWQWALMYGNKLESRPQYTPTDCFETFPFPSEMGLPDEIGRPFYGLRGEITTLRQIGLRDVYNLLHENSCNDPEIGNLRDLQVEMDRAVAAANGWKLDLAHGFHETKQGVRFTISPQARATVLDLLLALNHERHAAEQQQAPATKKRGKSKRTPAAATLFEP